MAARRFVRFLFVGLINTAFSYGLYSALLYFGAHYAAASLLALIGGILFSFRTQGKYVFGNTEVRLLGRFVVCWGIIYVFNIALIRAMLAIGFNAYLSGLLAIAPITVLSYMLQRALVFRAANARVARW